MRASSDRNMALMMGLLSATASPLRHSIRSLGRYSMVSTRCLTARGYSAPAVNRFASNYSRPLSYNVNTHLNQRLRYSTEAPKGENPKDSEPSSSGGGRSGDGGGGGGGG